MTVRVTRIRNLLRSPMGAPTISRRARTVLTAEEKLVAVVFSTIKSIADPFLGFLLTHQKTVLLQEENVAGKNAKAASWGNARLRQSSLPERLD